MEQVPLIHTVSVPEKVIAIGFDDGPHPLYTPQVLHILQKVNGLATFFMIGQQIEKFPEIAKQVLAAGHEIGNHTYHHPNLAELTEEEIYAELRKQEACLQQYLQVTPTVFRPPYFGYNATVEKVIHELGYEITAGAINGAALDWEMPGVDFIVEKSLQHVKNGSILIFHDSGSEDRSQTVAALDIVVQTLHEQGYRFITIHQLVELAQKQDVNWQKSADSSQL